MTKLTKSELNEKCAELRKKYKNVVPGSLENVATRGHFRSKRTVKVQCPNPKCRKINTTSTQELFHLVCEFCGESTVTTKRK